MLRVQMLCFWVTLPSKIGSLGASIEGYFGLIGITRLFGLGERLVFPFWINFLGSFEWTIVNGILDQYSILATLFDE